MEHNKSGNTVTHYVIFGITAAVVLVSVILVYGRRKRNPKTTSFSPITPLSVPSVQTLQPSITTTESLQSSTHQNKTTQTPWLLSETQVSQSVKDNAKIVNSPSKEHTHHPQTPTKITQQPTPTLTTETIPLTHPQEQPTPIQVTVPAITLSDTTVTEQPFRVTVTDSATTELTHTHHPTNVTAIPDKTTVTQVPSLVSPTGEGKNQSPPTTTTSTTSTTTSTTTTTDTMKQSDSTKEKSEKKQPSIPKLELSSPRDTLAPLKSPTRKTVSSPPSSASHRLQTMIPSLGSLEQLPRGKGGAKSFRRRAIAQWDYTGPTTYENKPVLQFKAGDEIRIIKMEMEDGWGWGELNDEEGFFPINYTKIGGPPTVRLDGNVSPLIKRLQGQLKSDV